MASRILHTKSDTTEGSPPVILIRLTQMFLSLNSLMITINFCLSKAIEISEELALLQKRHRALQSLRNLYKQVYGWYNSLPRLIHDIATMRFDGYFFTEYFYHLIDKCVVSASLSFASYITDESSFFI